MSERERYIGNPLRLMRCAVELGGMAISGLIRKVDDALDVDFDPADYRIPDFKVEAPVATEEELMDEGTQR